MVILDVNDSSISLLVVTGKKVDKAISLPLERGMVKDGVIENKTAVGQQIRQHMVDHNIRDKDIAACISGVHSIYRIITLPRVSGNLINEAVKREMQRVLPIPLEEVYVSWQTLTVTSIDMTICALGIPRNTIDALMTTLHQVGLDSRFMVLRPMALANLIDESTAMVVDVQPASFDIALVVDGVPVLLRSIVFTSRDMPDNQKVAMVAEEMERTVSFYNAGADRHVTLTREMATFVTGELVASLSGAIPYRLKQLPKTLAYPAGFNDSAYAASIGLAVAKFASGRSPLRITMNVMPESSIPKARLGTLVSWGAVVIVAIVIATFAYVTYREMARTATLQAQVNEAQQGVQNIDPKAIAEDTKKLQAKRDEALATLAMYRQPLITSAEQRAKVSSDLASVTRLLPGMVQLKTIQLGKSLTINGSATDKAIILSYVRALRDTNRFSSVILSTMTENQQQRWDFSLLVE